MCVYYTQNCIFIIVTFFFLLNFISCKCNHCEQGANPISSIFFSLQET